MTIFLLGERSSTKFQLQTSGRDRFGAGESSGFAGCELVKELIVATKNPEVDVVEVLNKFDSQRDHAYLPKDANVNHAIRSVDVAERANGHRSAVLCNSGKELISVECKANPTGPSRLKVPKVLRKNSDILCIFATLPEQNNSWGASNLALVDQILGEMKDQKGPFGQVVVSATLPNLKTLRSKPFKNLEALLKRSDVSSTLITNIGDFREKACIVSKGLTWEKTFFELQNLTKCDLNGDYDPSVSEISGFDDVIVRIGIDGACHIHNQDKDEGLVGFVSERKTKPKTSKETEKIRSRYDGFYFDPLVFEGELEATFDGEVSCQDEVFCASLILDWLDERDPKKSPDPIRRAIVAVRRNFLNGYKKFSGEIKGVDPFVVFDRKYVLTRGINVEFQPVSVLVETEELVQDDKDWRQSLTFYERITSLDYDSPSIREDAVVKIVRPLAEKIAIHGLRAASEEGFGVATFGNLQTIDRREIENLRSVYKRILEFVEEEKSQKPLSLAVFGPPGCGKSFSVKQLIKELSKSKPDVFSKETHEINIAQLSDPGELVSAFQAVRSDVIAGQMPIVFIDEFDSDAPGPEGNKWFKYFLAPMQDGTFRDDVSSHAIGKVIFVFAGGTAPSYRRFEAAMKENGTHSSRNSPEKHC